MLIRILLAALALALTSGATTAEPFALKLSKADQQGATLYIETTLPDNAKVRVSLYRTYEATTEGKSNTYSQNYFAEDGTVGQWRKGRLIPADDAAWMRELKAEQAKMARLGPAVAFDIDNIDNHLKASAYAYANKTGARFGAREYPSLLEKVKDTELVGNSEIRFMFPLSGSKAIAKRPMVVSGGALEIEHSYRLLGAKTPLMPEPEGGVEAIADMVYMPESTVVNVIGLAKLDNILWYHVALPAHSNREGWINSRALRAGAHRLGDGAPVTVSSGAPDYQAEIAYQVIDPCVRHVARTQMGGVSEARAVAILKTKLADLLASQINSMAVIVDDLDADTRGYFYKAGLGEVHRFCRRPLTLDR